MTADEVHAAMAASSSSRPESPCASRSSDVSLDAVLDALEVAHHAALAHGLSLDELLVRARQAHARWPEVIAAYGGLA